MRRHHLPLNLPADVYERLERQADAQERTPIQQARWLLRQSLPGPAPAGEPAAGRELALAGGDRPDSNRAA